MRVSFCGFIANVCKYVKYSTFIHPHSHRYTRIIKSNTQLHPTAVAKVKRPRAQRAMWIHSFVIGTIPCWLCEWTDTVTSHLRCGCGWFDVLIRTDYYHELTLNKHHYCCCYYCVILKSFSNSSLLQRECSLLFELIRWSFFQHNFFATHFACRIVSATWKKLYSVICK